MNCIKCGIELRDGAKFCDCCGADQNPKPKNKRKRANGQGTVYKRGKTWTARYIYGWEIIPEEKKKRPLARTKGGFATKKEAYDYISTLKVGNAAQAQTVESYWKLYEGGEFKKLSKDKKIAYRKAHERLMSIMPRVISTVSLSELQTIINEKVNTYYPARDIKTVISKLWRLAEPDGAVSKNLAPLLSLPEKNEKEASHFTDEHLKKLWSAFGDGELYAGYILLMCYTGMMPGELRGLRPEMIDSDNRRIVGAGIKTETRKEKSIILPEKVLLVADVIKDRTDGKFLKGVSENTFYKKYYAVLEKYGLPKYTPYACRHSTGTALALAGVTAPVIQRIMRHANITTTQRYMHLEDADAITVESANKIFS